MKKKEDLRITKTKASLYRGLMELMKKKTFEEIKVSEICSESYINRSTFYDHFNDKYELLQELLGDLREELAHNMNLDIKTNSIHDYYAEMLKVILNHISNNIQIYSAVSKINSNSVAKDMLTDVVVSSATKEIADNYKLPKDISAHSFALFYASGFITVILESLKDIEHYDQESLYNTLLFLIPDAILAK